MLKLQSSYVFSSLYWEFAQICLAFCFVNVAEFAKDLKVVACNFFRNWKQKTVFCTQVAYNTKFQWIHYFNTNETKHQTIEKKTGRRLDRLYFWHWFRTWPSWSAGCLCEDKKRTKAGRIMTPTEMKAAVWNLWHDNGIVSTLRSRHSINHSINHFVILWILISRNLSTQ